MTTPTNSNKNEFKDELRGDFIVCMDWYHFYNSITHTDRIERERERLIWFTFFGIINLFQIYVY